MAYFILNPNETDKTKIYRIAENDAEKNGLNISEDHIIIDVSDDDFNKLKNDTHNPSGHDGTNYTWVEREDGFATAEGLQNHLNFLSSEIEKWLSENPNRPDRSTWETYKGVIDSFDTSTISSWPLYKSWDEYCSENGINHKSLRQLP